MDTSQRQTTISLSGVAVGAQWPNLRRRGSRRSGAEVLLWRLPSRTLAVKKLERRRERRVRPGLGQRIEKRFTIHFSPVAFMGFLLIVKQRDSFRQLGGFGDSSLHYPFVLLSCAHHSGCCLSGGAARGQDGQGGRVSFSCTVVVRGIVGLE